MNFGPKPNWPHNFAFQGTVEFTCFQTCSHTVKSVKRKLPGYGKFYRPPLSEQVPASLDPLFRSLICCVVPRVYSCCKEAHTCVHLLFHRYHPGDSSIRHSVYSCSACCYHLSVRFVTSFRFSDSSMVSSLLSE